MAFIRTPAQSATSLVKYAQYLRDTPGIEFGVSSIDKKVIPARPGDLVAFVGRPGHAKSSIMSYFAKRTSNWINEEGNPTLDSTKPGQAVLYVTWEQLVETQETYIQSGAEYTSSDVHWGRVDVEAVRRASIKRAGLPLWIAGKSYYDDTASNKPMYIDALFEDIVNITAKYNVQFELICFDYLQEIPVKTKGKDARHLAVAEAVHGAKQLGMEVKCPVFIGVQAKDSVDKQAIKIPDMGDTYYSSELDHVIDKGFGLFKPSRAYTRGTEVTLNIGSEEHSLQVTDELFLMNLFKQRHETANHKFALYFDIPNMTMKDLELRYIPLDYISERRSL